MFVAGGRQPNSHGIREGTPQSRKPSPTPGDPTHPLWVEGTAPALCHEISPLPHHTICVFFSKPVRILRMKQEELIFKDHDMEFWTDLCKK